MSNPSNTLKAAVLTIASILGAPHSDAQVLAEVEIETEGIYVLANRGVEISISAQTPKTRDSSNSIGNVNILQKTRHRCDQQEDFYSQEMQA